MKKFEVKYSITGTVTIEAENEADAREALLSDVDSKALLDGMVGDIEDMGNDAITVTDVYES